MKSGGSPHQDLICGCHEPGNKPRTAQDATDTVKAHIESFPTYKSHYQEQTTPTGSISVLSWQFLRCFTSIRNSIPHLYLNGFIAKPQVLWRIQSLLWKVHVNTHAILFSHTHLLQVWIHMHVYTHNTLLHIHVLVIQIYTHTYTLTSLLQNSPKSDTCKTCDEYKVATDAETRPETKIQLMGEWDLHKRQAERTSWPPAAWRYCSLSIWLIYWNVNFRLTTVTSYPITHH